MSGDGGEREHWRGLVRRRPSAVVTPRPGQESVWDYPRPPRMESVSREIRVELVGVTLASSRRGRRVVETAGAPVYYFPPEDVRTELLEPSATTSLCEWKGRAAYWSVRVGSRFVADVGWSYPEPWAGFEAIGGWLAFYAARVDACFVGDQRATPQPGGFYGGWITPDVVGPFKGGPGTGQW